MGHEDSVKEEIRSRVDIVEYIGSSISLKRSGSGRYVACCPFHKEKTPSFIVNSQRQMYHCFGCGDGGDIFKWVMKNDEMTFPEALEFLAEKAGIVLPGYSRGEKDKFASARKALETASSLYQDIFWNSTQAKHARDYLLETRQIDRTIAERFQIGYSPDSWDFLINNLSKKEDISIQDLKLAGLIAENSQHSERIYDRFRGRLMFPIQDPSGRVIGFSARTLSSKDKVKYINSPETPFYRKGNVLYGLHLAKEAIHQTGRAVVVEGNIDVMRMHQEGHQNISAPCGTALTTSQALLLAKRFPGSEILYLFDGDKAGQEAAINAVGKTFWVGNVRASTLPEGKDPAGMYEEGLDVSPCLEKSQDGLEWLITTLSKKKRFNPREFSGQQVLVDHFKDFLQDAPSEYKGIALDLIAQRLGVQPSSLQGRFFKRQDKLSNLNVDGGIGREILEKRLLYQMAHVHDLDSWDYLLEKRHLLDSFQNPCFKATLNFLAKHFNKETIAGSLFEKPEESVSCLLREEIASGKTIDVEAVNIFFERGSYSSGKKKSIPSNGQENSETLQARQERMFNERKRKTELFESKRQEEPKLVDLEATLDALIAVNISEKMIKGMQSGNYVPGLSHTLDRIREVLRSDDALH
jgi:DNA primase catalytic core